MPTGIEIISKPKSEIKVVSKNVILPTLETLTVVNNGTYTPTQGVDGYNQVIVNVPQNTDIADLYNEAYMLRQDAGGDISILGQSKLVLSFDAKRFSSNLEQAFRDNSDIVFVGNISGIITLSETFYGCSNLKHIGVLECSEVTDVEGAFSDCESLVEIEAMNNLGDGFEGEQYLDFSSCVQLSVGSFINIAKTISPSTGMTINIIAVNSFQFEELDSTYMEYGDEEITILDCLTRKGWSVFNV